MSHPDKKLIPSRGVCNRYGLKAIRTLKNRWRAGVFPPPDVTIRNKHYWWESTLETHERSLVRQRGTESQAEPI